MRSRAISGRWKVFFLFLGVAFGFPLIGAIWPIATREAIAYPLNLAISLLQAEWFEPVGKVLIAFVFLGFALILLINIFLSVINMYERIKSRGESSDRPWARK